ILVVVFLFLSMTLGYTLLEGWYSFGIFSLLTFFFSIIYLNRNYPDEKVQLVKLFLIFYSVYSLYTYLTNFLYVDDPRTDFFMMVDSKKFWIFSDYKISDFSEVIDIQRDSLVATSRYILFNFINLIF